jgi:hypothetical protein
VILLGISHDGHLMLCAHAFEPGCWRAACHASRCLSRPARCPKNVLRHASHL